MLTIEVNGNALHIKRETSLQMEVNSSFFSTDGMEGDVMFTFDVPAASNDTVFRHARFVYVQRLKKYACAVKAGGVEIARGDLYIQRRHWPPTPAGWSSTRGRRASPTGSCARTTTGRTS